MAAPVSRGYESEPFLKGMIEKMLKGDQGLLEMKRAELKNVGELYHELNKLIFNEGVTLY